jgi:hypothetical protein
MSAATKDRLIPILAVDPLKFIRGEEEGKTPPESWVTLSLDSTIRTLIESSYDLSDDLKASDPYVRQLTADRWQVGWQAAADDLEGEASHTVMEITIIARPVLPATITAKEL